MGNTAQPAAKRNCTKVEYYYRVQLLTKGQKKTKDRQIAKKLSHQTEFSDMAVEMDLSTCYKTSYTQQFKSKVKFIEVKFIEGMLFGKVEEASELAAHFSNLASKLLAINFEGKPVSAVQSIKLDSEKSSTFQVIYLERSFFDRLRRNLVSTVLSIPGRLLSWLLSLLGISLGTGIMSYFAGFLGRIGLLALLKTAAPLLSCVFPALGMILNLVLTKLI